MMRLSHDESAQARGRWSGDITHLLLDVVERVRGVDGEADEDDVRIGV